MAGGGCSVLHSLVLGEKYRREREPERRRSALLGLLC